MPHRCAHPALRYELKVRCAGAGFYPAPAHNRMIFIKMSFRGAKQRGNPYSPYGRGRCGGITDCRTGDAGHRLAMTGFLRARPLSGGASGTPTPTQELGARRCGSGKVRGAFRPDGRWTTPTGGCSRRSRRLCPAARRRRTAPTQGGFAGCGGRTQRCPARRR